MARDPLSALTQAVESVESGGRRYGPGGGLLTSPRGAMGEMQVMPGTARDPGFGVKPARSGDPEDLARVGRDYLSAMVGRYGDVDRALVAYNWGPGNADRWLKEGADPAKLPKETADYLQRVRSKLPADFSLAAVQPEQVQQAEASVDEPTPAEQLAAAPEPRPEVRGTIPTPRLTQSYGPGYQAALAVSFLADEKEGEKALPTDESEAEKLIAAPTGRMARSALADLDLSYQSPFDQPVRMADGGLALRPSVYLPPVQQKKLEAARTDLERYSKEAEAYNAAADEWNKSVYQPYAGSVDAFNTARQQYIADVYTPYQSQVNEYNTALQKYLTDVYNPYQSQVDAYNKAVEAWNAGPRTSDFTQVAPTAPAEFSMKEPAAPAAFSMVAPTAPEPFSMAAPPDPSVSPDDYVAMQRRAKMITGANKLAFDVVSDPGKYNLSFTKMFAEGGEVAQDPEMPPDQAVFGRYPSSGIGRPQSGYSEALQSGSAAREMLRGMTLAPQYLLGAPVDLATMAMRPFGYSEKEPVGGSEWLIRKSREMGIAPKEPELQPEKLAFGAGEIAGQLVSPVAATETAVRGAGRLAERTGEAARMLMQATEGGPRPVPGGFGASQRGAVDVGGKKGPIYQETPTPDSPFVSKLDNFVANMPGAVRKEQFLNSLKGKFKAHEIQRAEEVLSDVPSDAKLTQSDLLNRLKSKYDPAGYAIEIRPPSTSADEVGLNYQSFDNVYKDKPLGVINLYEKPSIRQAELESNLNNAKKSVDALYAMRYSPSPKDVKNFRSMPDNFKNFVKEYDPTYYKLLDRLNKKLDSYLKDVKETSYTNSQGNIVTYYALDPSITNALYAFRAYETPTEETNRIFQKYLADKGIKDLDKLDPYDRSNLYRTAINEEDARVAAELVSSLEKEYPALKKIGYRPTADNMAGGVFDPNTSNERTREVFMREYYDLVKIKHEGTMNDAKMLFTSLEPVVPEYNKYLKEAYKGDMPYASQHPSLTPYGSVSFSRFSEHEAQVPGYGNLKGIYLNELQSDRLDDVRKGTSGAKEAFKGMKDQPQTTQQLMIKSAIAAALQRGDNFVAFPGAESAQRQLYEKLPRNLNEVVKDLGPGFEVRPIELSNAEGQVFTHPAVIIDPFPSKSRLFNRPTPDQLLNKGIPFADGGEVKRKRRGRKSQPAPDTSMSRRSLDEYLQQEGWRNPRPFDADTLEYAQQLAQRNPDYGDMLKYLEMRGARPESSFVPMRGDRANYRAYFEAPDAEGRDPGSLGINRDYQYGDPRRVVPALIHETTHAADRQMRTQYGERAPKSEARRMFEEAYKKFGREEMAKRLDPEWAKKYSGYRASERELPAQAMGNLVQYDPRAVNEPVEAYNTPTHLDPTMATEFLIMQDLARRAQEASQQPAP